MAYVCRLDARCCAARHRCCGLVATTRHVVDCFFGQWQVLSSEGNGNISERIGRTNLYNLYSEAESEFQQYQHAGNLYTPGRY